jgi:hypothetical protein
MDCHFFCSSFQLKSVFVRLSSLNCVPVMSKGQYATVPALKAFFLRGEGGFLLPVCGLLIAAGCLYGK